MAILRADNAVFDELVSKPWTLTQSLQIDWILAAQDTGLIGIRPEKEPLQGNAGGDGEKSLLHSTVMPSEEVRHWRCHEYSKH